ncbi:MAG: hypothetical protein WC417_07255 [Candidatus Omnitrophota bacterium]|jgi:hypothetical protein
MAKKILLAVLAVALCAGQTCAQETSPTSSILVDIHFESTLDFGWNMHKLSGEVADPWGGIPDQQAMSFGFLTYDFSQSPLRLYTDTWYALFLWVNANTPYHIKQVSQSLMTVDGQYNLDKSFIVVPDYSAEDKWDGQWPQGDIGGDVLGPATLVKDADILYYGNDGVGHILRFFYSIPKNPQVEVPGWEPVDLLQNPGKYQGSVTISITPQAP